MKKKDRRKNWIAFFSKRVISFVLAASIAIPVSLCVRPETVQAAGGMMKLSTAKSVAVARSDKIESLELQITTKRAARDSAVRALREKEHNMRTFRWSPLLNFKFPTKPSEAESFEFQYKPTQLEYQIKDIQHKITDEKLAEYEKVSNLYIGIIQAEQELNYVNKRIENVDLAYQKAQVKQKTGEVSEDVVENLKKRLDTLKSKKTEQETKFQRNKEKLGKELKVDLTTNYIFENAFATADMSRKNIEYLQTYALERDHTVYEAQQTADLALLSLQTNYELFRSQYGRYIGTISSYVQQAMDGSDVNQKAYNKAYDKFLKEIDSPWSGNYKILFIKFPKSYLKGDSDGMNWIEDDPKVLFTDTMDYVSARKELENTKEDIKSAIEDGYDTYIAAKKAYVEANGTLLELQNKLIEDEVKNLMGELDNDEFETEKQEYEAAETAANEALGAYSTTLYSYDKTCCGGVSQFLQTASDRNQLQDDLNALEGVTKTGAHYSIRSIISDSEFIVTIDVPPYDDQEYLDDNEEQKNPDYFPYEITDFELRINNRQIGKKTSKDGSVRHLKLDKDNADEVVIRLWNGDEFIDDVVIDATVPWGPLDITTEYKDPEALNLGVIGTYKVEDDTTTDMIRMTFDFDQDAVKKEFGQGKEAAYYTLSAERTLYLFSDHLVEVSQPFSYLSFIRGDLNQLTMRVYDKDGNLLGGARFDTVNEHLVKDPDVGEADMQDVALQELATKNKTDELNTELAKAKQALAYAEENGDTTDADYYKNRISTLEQQLANVAESITDEDLEKVKTEQAEELQKLTEEKTENLSKTDEEKAKDADDEQKRQQILHDAAEEVVAKMKYDESMADLKKQRDSWAYKETELQEKFNQLSKEKGASDPEAKAVLEELQAAKRQKRAVEDEIKTHSVFNREEFPVTEEETQMAMNLYPEEVYATAEPRLGKLDSYSGPAYETAKAEAELYGIDPDPENLKFLVGYADNIKKSKDMQHQIETMTKDRENLQNQIDSIKNLPDDDPRKLSQSTILPQLEKVRDTYDKQLEILKQQESEINPAKVLKRQQISDAIRDEQEVMKGIEATYNEKKGAYEDAVKELENQMTKLITAQQNQEKYHKEEEYQQQLESTYRALKEQYQKKADNLQEELDDMNWFEKAGNVIRKLWGDSHEDRINKALKDMKKYAEQEKAATNRKNELHDKLIPQAEQDEKDAKEAIPGCEKKREDTKVEYDAATDDYNDQNARIDNLMNLLKAV